MPVFIDLTTEMFERQFPERVKDRANFAAGKASVRRPLRGIEVKEDTYAYIKLVDIRGREIPLFDSNKKSGRSTELSNFIIQSLAEQRMEKHQVVETFGETYLFVFGDSPRFLQISAVLLNTFDFNWEAEFAQNYEKYLRGTKSIERGARTYLYYDSTVVEGYVLNMQIQKTAENPWMIPLNFQFFVTQSETISMTEENGGRMPISASAVFPSGISPTGVYGDKEIATLTGGNGTYTPRTVPNRSFLEDNYDEYTNPRAGDLETILSLSKNLGLPVEVDNLNNSLAKAMEHHGVDAKSSGSPSVSKDLGMLPSFPTSKDGKATLGATTGAGSNEFAGVKVAGSTNSSYAGTYAGVGATATSGGFSNSKDLVMDKFIDQGKDLTFDPMTGSATLDRVNIGDIPNKYNNAYMASMPGSKVGTASEAALSNAALAGGYSYANSSLGAQSAVGQTHQGDGSSSGSIRVGGSPSIFAASAVSGSLENETIQFVHANNP